MQSLFHHKPHPLRRRLVGIVSIVSIVGLALLLALPVAAQGQEAIVRIAPAVAEVTVGQTVTLEFELSDARNAYGIDVRATFDSKVIEVVDADPDTDGVQLNPGDFLRPDFVARNTADNAAGTLRYALTQVNPTEPASGTGVIFTVQFRGKAAGESALKLEPVELADRQGQLQPVTIQGGVIKVVAGQAATQAIAPTQPSPVVEPTASAVPTAIPAATVQPAGSPALPAGFPCAGAAIAPALGLLGLVGWGARHRRNE